MKDVQDITRSNMTEKNSFNINCDMPTELDFHRKRSYNVRVPVGVKCLPPC